MVLITTQGRHGRRRVHEVPGTLADVGRAIALRATAPSSTSWRIARRSACSVVDIAVR